MIENNISICFVSNYYNHHQAPLSDEFDKQTAHNYYFIETIPMEQERKNLGWGSEDKPSYVLQSYLNQESMNRCKELIMNADVVIWGSCPFGMIRPRLKAKKLTFAYSERLFKESNIIKVLLRALKHNFKLRLYQKNHYLLCASAYAARDYKKIGLFRNRALMWGYFPCAKTYENIDALISKKEKNSIIWCARFIEWKHPEIAVDLAQYLKEKGYDFKLNMIGTGPLQKNIELDIKSKDLSDNVAVLGAMSPEKVREYMEASEIFIFTSDRNEGWGAVLNEAMNSGCAVVACESVGSVPCMVKDGENGFVFGASDLDTLYEKVTTLISSKQMCRSLGEAAYETVAEHWNAKTAAMRLLVLAESLSNGGDIPYADGICGPAVYK